MQTTGPRDLGALILAIGVLLVLFIVSLSLGRAAPLSASAALAGGQSYNRSRCQVPAMRSW